MTREDLERIHVYDNDYLWEGPFLDATDMTLPGFLAELQKLDRQHPGQDYIFSSEGAAIFLWKQLFNMGVWYGLIAYRNEILDNLDADTRKRVTGIARRPPYRIDEGEIAGLVSDLDNMSDNIADRFMKLFPLYGLEEAGESVEENN